MIKKIISIKTYMYVDNLMNQTEIIVIAAPE